MLTFYIFVFFAVQPITSTLLNDINLIETQPEDASLNFTELANKYDYKSIRYEVITEDGYIISLFHIPGDKSRPVLYTHGLGETGDTAILRGKHSLLAMLADAGFDVWILNCRGNRYSNCHVTLDSHKDNAYWLFSFHQIAIYDLPAAIDLVLYKTGQKSLSSIGFSQGTTIHYILLSMRPEYNEKIRVFIALAPVAFFNHPSPQLLLFLKLVPLINGLFKTLNVEKIFGDDAIETTTLRLVCNAPDIGYKICSRERVTHLVGLDSKGVEPKMFKTLLGHAPMSITRMTLVHYTQFYERKSFGMYDYGAEDNLKMYGSAAPPDYDLSKITAKIALFRAAGDLMTSLEDIGMLKERLPNVVLYHMVDEVPWVHVDYTLHRRAFN